MSRPNCVPAVAAIRKRLVLFILNRFKGYPSCKICLKLGNNFTRVLYEKVVPREKSLNLMILLGLIGAKATF